MGTDVSLDAIEIIRLYALRFKIEYSFKQAVRTIGSFAYHFWSGSWRFRRDPSDPSLLAADEASCRM
jgi:hypothetical protein